MKNEPQIISATLTRKQDTLYPPPGANGRTDPLVTTLPKSSLYVK